MQRVDADFCADPFLSILFRPVDYAVESSVDTRPESSRDPDPCVRALTYSGRRDIPLRLAANWPMTPRGRGFGVARAGGDPACSTPLNATGTYTFGDLPSLFDPGLGPS